MEVYTIFGTVSEGQVLKTLISTRDSYFKIQSLKIGINRQPLFDSVIMGVFAGKNIKKLWGMPIISAVLFLLGSWKFFGMGEKAFIMYAGIYMILGVAAMIISRMFFRKLQR